jgi:putative tricarboxylic transport membrane protein
MPVVSTIIATLLKWCLSIMAFSLPGIAVAWTPEKPIELVVPTAAGGGLDQTMRAIEQILREQNMVNVPITVVNRPGGGHAIAATSVHQSKGDPHRILLLSSTLLSNPIMGRMKMRYTDFTVLGQIYTEYMMVAVNSASPIKSGKDLVSRLKQAPDALSVAVGSALGTTSHLGIAVPMKEAGVDIKAMKSVVFPAAQGMTNLLGGHVDVTAGPLTAAAPHWRAGKLRVIAVGAPERLGGEFASIPTWREQKIDGVNGVVANPRILVAPPGLTSEQMAYWDDLLERLVKSPEWLQRVEKHQWVNHYIPRREISRYLAEEEKVQREILTELGLAK